MIRFILTSDNKSRVTELGRKVLAGWQKMVCVIS